MLNLTTTGVPFLDGGRTSATKIDKQVDWAMDVAFLLNSDAFHSIPK